MANRVEEIMHGMDLEGRRSVGHQTAANVCPDLRLHQHTHIEREDRLKVVGGKNQGHLLTP